MNKYIILVIVAFFFVESCDMIDGTGIENPDLPLEEAVNAPNSAEPWVNGLNEQLATVYNQFVVTAELTTDNYENVQTFFNQNVDEGTYRDIDDDFDDTQTQLSTLREQAEFGLERVLKNNPGAQGTPLEAEMHFYKGFANLMIGELITRFPAEPQGEPLPPENHFLTAVTDFTNAINIDPANISYHIALARAHYNLGNQAEAVSAAEDAIAANPANDYVRFVQFDGVDGPTSSLQNAVYDRGNFDDLQPLPRLDFLDPKYAQDGNQESPIPMFKIEEAHLILAEAELTDDDLLGARTIMNDIITMVNNRPTRDFDETIEQRQDPRQDPPFQRPDSSSFDVLFSPSDTNPKSGYVLDRTASTTVPTISGTNVTSSDVNNLLSVPEAIELLYLMRQEIFFGEGRRMFDLGIRWPVHEIEALNNPNITDSDRQAVVPADLPSGPEMDAFTINGEVVTMSFNVNSILAQRGTRFD